MFSCNNLLLLRSIEIGAYLNSGMGSTIQKCKKSYISGDEFCVTFYFLSCSEIQKHTGWDWGDRFFFTFHQTSILWWTATWLNHLFSLICLLSVKTGRAQTVSLDWKNRWTVIKGANQDLSTSRLCFSRLPQRDLLREPVICADTAITLNEMSLFSCDIMEIKNQ